MPFSIQTGFPEEICDRIASLSSRVSLVNLCLCSRTLNRISTPHLYSTIYLKQGANLDGPLNDLLPLAYLIFSSPAHASLVRSIAGPDRWGDPDIVEEFPDQDRRLWPYLGDSRLENVLRKKCAEYAMDEKEAEKIYHKIRPGTNEDALLALLIASLPNLQRVDLNMGCATEHPELVAMLERVGKRVKPFDQLPWDPADLSAVQSSAPTKSMPFSLPLDIMVKCYGDKYPQDTVHLAMFLNLPNLRSIYVWMSGDSEVEPDVVNGSFAKLRPRSCPVEYIELRTSKLHKHNLQLLMNSTIPGKLRSFNYEVGSTWAWCNIEHLAIMNSMEQHHHTLESLCLSHHHFYPFQFDNPNEKPDPISFAPFTALTRIKVAPVYIWGHEGFHLESELKKPNAKEMLWRALPASIEDLWITWAQQQKDTDKNATVEFVPDCLIPAIGRLVQQKSQYFPRLTHFRIQFETLRWKTEWFDSLASVCALAEHAHIRCTIIPAGPPPWYGREKRDLGWKERNWGWEENVEWDEIYFNSENPTTWLHAEELGDLGERLRTVKAKLQEEEKERQRQSEEWKNG